ncbi:hypothetical protein J2755_001773 [Methanohalophilus levihalophilus]|uniref:hypothetical protein n=1 Tax=Methanohalophilus levihalophilus TaxID=1431282 RepID=UPI001AE4B07F|nr:hypothetical protein [Methanohalophilus levihalophilus]MBP2030825.1 hypothetical protein [Methanohalophilus levihalophilus]
MNGIVNHIFYNYKSSTQAQILSNIKAFYISNGMIIDPKAYSPRILDDDGEEIEEVDNTYFLSKDEIRLGLGECQKFLKAFALCELSSGLSKVDITQLTVRKFREGYDPKYKICKIEFIRQKMKNKPKKAHVKHHTYISTEACEAIIDYLEYRMGYGIDYDDLSNNIKKQYIYSEDDALFCRPEPRNEFLKYVADGEYTRMYEVKNKSGVKGRRVKKKQISPDTRFRKFEPKELDRFFEDAS